MGIYVNSGNEGFKSALNSQIYIDKTGMLEYTNRVLNTESRYICVSRPRRFGKSITAQMLVAYYDKTCDSKEMFRNFEIAKSPDFEKHLNQYNVIHVDVNDFLHRTDFETKQPVTAMQAIALFQSNIIEELKAIFPDSVIEMDVDLPTTLAKIHADTGTQFIIIIDEWDTLFREKKQDAKAQNAYIELLRGLFKDARSKKFLKLAYLTGILPIKKYNTQSALNNFDEFTMTNPLVFSKYVGFTKDEVQSLCKQYDMDFDEIQYWYDGYSFKDDLHIYNPNSVVKAMIFGECNNYWTRTETYESLRGYISMNFDGLKDAVVQMIAGGRYKVNPDKFQNDMVSFHSKDDILTLLIHLGYLAYDFMKREAYIPNEEVRGEFRNAIEDSGWEPVIDAIEASDRLLKATWEKDELVVAKGIEKVHMEQISVLSYNDENSLSCVISLAYYNAINEYTLVREMPAGKGYADIVFLPRKHSDKPAMVVELKYDQSAEGAIEQIKERKYMQILEAYRGNILLVGINYDKKNKEHHCRIEEWNQCEI